MKIIVLALMLIGCVTTEPAVSRPVSFNLPDYMNSRQRVSSQDIIGKIVLEFYFNGCPACNNNASNFLDMYREHRSNAQFLEVSIDCDDSDYLDWTRSHRPQWPVLMDCARVLSEGNLNVASYPTTIVLDSGHNVIYRTSGVWNQSKKRAIAAAIME